jgi:hypothetical protein
MDRAIAEGQWQAMMPAVFPLIRADLAGVVEAVSEGTSRFCRARNFSASC